MRVLLADRHTLVRQGLMALLAREWPGCSFLEAASLGRVQELLERGPIDLLVIDRDLPGMRPGAVQALRAPSPALRVAVLADAAGVPGCLDTAVPAEQLLQAIRAVMAGAVLVPVHAASCPVLAVANLTSRQQDVLKLLMGGNSTKAIARSLNLGVGTVKVHLNGVYRTLGARNRTEAVARVQGLN